MREIMLVVQLLRDGFFFKCFHRWYALHWPRNQHQASGTFHSFWTLRFLLVLAALATVVISSPAPSIRLHTRQPLAASSLISLEESQRHYLFSVMRARAGDSVALFNGQDGEWLARISTISKSSVQLSLQSQLRPQRAEDGATLLFGVLKGARLPMLVEKATELGVSQLQPVLMQHCAARAVNVPRLQAIAVEAAEQSGRLTVPSMGNPLPLKAALQKWSELQPSRALCVCDERGGSRLIGELAASGEVEANSGVLIGPEGGFSSGARFR